MQHLLQEIQQISLHFLNKDSVVRDIPKYNVKDGYEITGWTVTGSETTTWSKDKTTFTLSDVNAAYSDNGEKVEGFATVVPVVSKKEESKKVVVNATVKVDPNKGYFEVYGDKEPYETTNENLQDDGCKLGYLPKVVAKDGYTWTGWKVKDEGGNVVYSNITTDTFELMFDCTKSQNYTVEATFEENKAEEKTVEVYFNIIDSEKGSFPDYAPSTVVSFKGIAADTDQQFEIPAVKANDGYKFTGWKVEGAETQNWDADAKTFGVTGLAHFPEGSNVGYVTITPEFEKVEETPAVAVANATVVIDSNEGSFEGYEGTTELHNENLQDSKYNLGFLPTVVANEGYTFKGWKVTNKAGEEIYNLDANATSISFPYGVADDYTVTAVLEKNETPVDPDQPSVDPSKPSTPEEKPGTSIEENKKDDKTSTTVAKDDKKTNKKESAKKANEQKSDTVQTGDHSNVFVYVATLLIAGVAAVVAFFRRRNA